MNYLKLAIIGILVLWILGFWYMLTSHSDDTLIKRLEEAEKQLKDLELLNKNNAILIKSLKNKADYLTKVENNNEKIKAQDDTQILDTSLQNFNYEEIRRKVFNDIKDVSFYMKSQIKRLKSHYKGKQNDVDYERDLNRIYENFDHRIKTLLTEFHNLSNHKSDWRIKRSKELSTKVQEIFHKMQNPSDCSKARTLLCDLNKACGFGCQMHHAMYCFIEAYFQNRTMILESNDWRYDSRGYETYFQPVTETCAKTSFPDSVSWNDNIDPKNLKSIRIPIVDARSGKPDYLPLGLPSNLAEEIKEFHDNPFVWWAGQILTYLMRYKPDFEKILDDNAKRLGLRTPCVGVHVRRTDKIGTEAAFHDLAEYMEYVDDFFDVYELSNPNVKAKRAVYLATDELSVLSDTEKFKDYDFIFDREITKSAGVQQRYSPEALQGIIMDIHYLSKCDYLVCTFSSQVCRMAYELLQNRYADASWRFKSLDDIYYFGGQNAHYVIAVMDHVPQTPDEIELKVGDHIGIAGNHWDGYSKGRNYRTNNNGLFPSYKVKDSIIKV